MSSPVRPCWLLLGTGWLLAACGSPGPTGSHQPAPVVAPTPAGRVVLTPVARSNLGLTFAKAEYRVVQSTIRLGGRFESEPSARRTYRVPLPGRATLLVKPYAQVTAGLPLARIESQEWRRLQRELAEATAAVSAAADELAAATARSTAIDEALAVWQGRLSRLDQLGQELGGKAGERAEAAARVAELRIQQADAQRGLAAARREASGAHGGGAARTRWNLLVQMAADLTGEKVEDLAAADASGLPRWQRIEALMVTAAAAGVVEPEVAGEGAWLEAHAPILTITDPQGVRLRAAGLQADLPRLRDGMSARIVAYDPAEAGMIPVSVVIGPQADAIDRTVDLIARPAPGAVLPAWVRPGVTALLELAVRGGADEELAIPLAATVPDGLTTVLFRRDPKDPQTIIRMEADLGVDDGRWVVVNSGLKEGDEVVVGGIHPLRVAMQTQAGPAAKPDPHAGCGGH